MYIFAKNADLSDQHRSVGFQADCANAPDVLHSLPGLLQSIGIHIRVRTAQNHTSSLNADVDPGDFGGLEPLLSSLSNIVLNPTSGQDDRDQRKQDESEKS